MPDKATAARRHRIPTARYRIANWRVDDAALRNRGDLTLSVPPEALAAWHPPPTGQRGRAPPYSAVAIEPGVIVRLAFRRPWRPPAGPGGVLLDPVAGDIASVTADGADDGDPV